MSRKAAQFVVKLSKYCNLRCAYCYEFHELADKRRMGLDDLARMFDNIAGHAAREGYESVSFVWHGGEPLLIPIDYYRAILERQRAAFEGRVAWWNTTQTNMTILTDAWIDFLRGREFLSGLGVSFDVYGDQRVDTKGQLRTDQVLDNIQRASDAGVGFGGICVLARNTLPHVAAIYRFFDDIRTPVRFLPFYRSAEAAQVEAHGLEFDEIVEGFTAALDAFLQSQNGAACDPIEDFIDAAARQLSGRPRPAYDKERDEFVFVVNTNGDVWGVSETYGDPQYRYGNLFQEDLGAVLNSPGRKRAIEAAQARMDRHCADCPHFGPCPGYHVGDATDEQARTLETRGCVAREMIDRAIDRLAATDLAGKLLARRPSQAERNATP